MNRKSLILTHEKQSQESISVEKVLITEEIGSTIKNILVDQCGVLGIDIYYNKHNTEYHINLIPFNWKGFPPDLWFRYYLPDDENYAIVWVAILTHKIETEIKKLMDQYEKDQIEQPSYEYCPGCGAPGISRERRW